METPLERAPAALAAFAGRDELWLIWQAAEFGAVAAYGTWSASPGATAYSVYRAAQDRADRAQGELADEHAKAIA